MIRRLIITFGFLFLLFNNIPNTQAHIGGIPFININDKPTLVNQFNNYSGRLDIPQDNSAETFLAGQPIKFEVIQKFLQIPEDVFKKSQFRWKFDQDKDNYETGSLISHTFTEPKTYFSLLEVKGPDQADFQPLNTLGINIVADSSYKLPKINLSVETDNNKPNKPIKYISEVTTDPTTQVTSYSWDFDDEQVSNEASPIHKFADENIIHGVTLKVTDSNGYTSYAGLQIFENEGKLEISNIQPGEPEVPVNTNFNASPTINSFLYIIPVLLVLTISIYIYRKKRH